MKQLGSRLWREEARQDLNEYPLLMALIALSAISWMQSLAQAVSSVYGSAASNLSTT
jgi:Flp pilus assembly pilin Flp